MHVGTDMKRAVQLEAKLDGDPTSAPACCAASTTWRGRLPTAAELAAVAEPQLAAVFVFFRGQGLTKVLSESSFRYSCKTPQAVSLVIHRSLTELYMLWSCCGPAVQQRAMLLVVSLLLAICHCKSQLMGCCDRCRCLIQGN